LFHGFVFCDDVSGLFGLGDRFVAAFDVDSRRNLGEVGELGVIGEVGEPGGIGACLGDS
jgi:hypothetical protein